jgi:hypothetical protein
MKKRIARKLSLSRETIHRLTDSALARAGGALEDGVVVIGGEVALSIPVCTNVISDCLYCTTPLNSCPKTMQTYCDCA